MSKLSLPIKMIRKISLGFAAVVFASGVLATSVIRTTAQTSPLYKITPMVAGEKIEVAPEATPAPSKVDYYLPYPGILPDHFLYPLKMIRDRVWLFLTRDSLKRTEVLLLFADKRVGAAKALIEGGQEQLGLSTITKAEKYLERAILQAEKVKAEGRDVSALYEKLTKATLKHEEILTGLLEKVSDGAKPVIQEALHYSREGYKKVAPVEKIEEELETQEGEEEITPTPGKE